MLETTEVKERGPLSKENASIAARKATRSRIAGLRVVERLVRDQKGKSKDGKDKLKAATASSMPTEKEANAAWMAMSAFSIEADNLFEESELPDLIQLPESDDESDSDLDELGTHFEDAETDDEEFLLQNSAVESVERVLDLPDKAYTTTYTKAELENSVDIDLYDSGASRHMSGYRHRFINFRTIESHPITAADKRTFNAYTVHGQGQARLARGPTRPDPIGPGVGPDFWSAGPARTGSGPGDLRGGPAP